MARSRDRRRCLMLGIAQLVLKIVFPSKK